MMSSDQSKESREKRIREIAELLYASVQAPPLFDRNRWTGRLFSWADRDDAFRTNMFRFVDLLPALSSDQSVVQLLQEYFSGRDDAPLLIRQGVRRIPRVMPALAARLIRTGVETVARQFIAGADVSGAAPALRELWLRGTAHSVDLLGEAVLSDKEALNHVRRYRESLRALASEVSGWPADPLLESDDRGVIPRVGMSLKVSSFDPFPEPADPDGAVSRLKEAIGPVITEAQERNAAVCFDMETHDMKGLTIECFKAVMEECPGYEDGGIALQAYLRKSRSDLLELINWAAERRRRITIRLVKGAYWDYEFVMSRRRGWPEPVFLTKGETDRNFEELTVLLLSGSPYVRPAIATHNIRDMANAIAVARERGLPKNSFEFQMLYGMGEPFIKVLREMGYRLRVYTPVGQLIPGMAYLVRRLLENSANESVFRRMFGVGASLEDLIAPPPPGRAAAPTPSVDGFRNEPLTDFSLSDNRLHMKKALQDVRHRMGRSHPLVIGGEEVFTGLKITSINPAAPSEIVGTVASASPQEADAAVTVARDAWTSWRRTGPVKRAEFLLKAAAAMRKDRFDLMALEVYEVGKTWTEADGDVAEAIDYLEYYGMQMKRLSTPRFLGDYPGELNEYRHGPLGVGVVIAPWNFPLAIATGMVSAALVTGNCAIFKPSGLSPVIGAELVRYIAGAGLPPGVLQFLPGPGSSVGSHLVAHPDVDFIAFTGSREAGLDIIRRASETSQSQRTIKKVISEMGGKNAIIIDDTADLDEAVRGVVESALGYQGQKCSACSRVIVTPGVFDLFLDRLTEAVRSIRTGSPEDPGSFMGPLIDDKAVLRLRDCISQARKEGRVVLSAPVPGEGLYVGPVIVTGIDPSSSLAQDEIFGPFIVVLRAADMDDAVRIANGVPFALTGGIYSRSPANIRVARQDLNVGNLYVNRKITGALVGRQPFGGHGMSGAGSKAGGPEYLLQFMHPLSVSENTMRRGFVPKERGPRHGGGSV